MEEEQQRPSSSSGGTTMGWKQKTKKKKRRTPSFPPRRGGRIRPRGTTATATAPTVGTTMMNGGSDPPREDDSLAEGVSAAASKSMNPSSEDVVVDPPHPEQQRSDDDVGGIGVGVVNAGGEIHHHHHHGVPVLPTRKLLGATMKIPKLLPSVSRSNGDHHRPGTTTTTSSSNENAILGALMRKTRMRSHYDNSGKGGSRVFRRSSSEGSFGSRGGSGNRVRSFVSSRRRSFRSSSSSAASSAAAAASTKSRGGGSSMDEATSAAERQAMSSLLLGGPGRVGSEFDGNDDDFGEWEEEDDRSVVSNDPFEHHQEDGTRLDPWRCSDGRVRSREDSDIDPPKIPPPPRRDIPPPAAAVVVGAVNDTTSSSSSPYDFTWLNEWLDEASSSSSAQLPPADRRMAVDVSSAGKLGRPSLDDDSDRNSAPHPPPERRLCEGGEMVTSTEMMMPETTPKAEEGAVFEVSGEGHDDPTLDEKNEVEGEEKKRRKEEEENLGNKGEGDFPEVYDIDDRSWCCHGSQRRPGGSSSPAARCGHAVASEEDPEESNSSAMKVSDPAVRSAHDLNGSDPTETERSHVTTFPAPHPVHDSVPHGEGLRAARSWDDRRKSSSATQAHDQSSSSLVAPDFLLFDDDSFRIVRTSASADGVLFGGAGGDFPGLTLAAGDDDASPSSLDEFSSDPFGVGGGPSTTKEEADSSAPRGTATGGAAEDERSVASSFDCDRLVDTCHSSGAALLHQQQQQRQHSAATMTTHEPMEEEYVDHSCSTPLERLARDVETYLRRWHVAEVDRHVGASAASSPQLLVNRRRPPPRRSVSCSRLPSSSHGGEGGGGCGLPPPSPLRAGQLVRGRSGSVVDAIATPPRGGGGAAPPRVGMGHRGGGGRLLRRGHVLYQQPPGGWGGFQRAGSSSPRRRSAQTNHRLRLTLSLWDAPSPRDRREEAARGQGGDLTSSHVPLSLRHPTGDDGPTVVVASAGAGAGRRRPLDLSLVFGIGQYLTLSPTPTPRPSGHSSSLATEDNEEVMRRLPEGCLTSIRTALQLATESAGCEIPAFVLRCRYDPDRVGSVSGSRSGSVGDDDDIISTIPAWVRLGNTPICCRRSSVGNGGGRISSPSRLRRFFLERSSSDRGSTDDDGGRSRLVGYCTPRSGSDASSSSSSCRGYFSLEFFPERSLLSSSTSPMMTFDDVVRLYHRLCKDDAGRQQHDDDPSPSIDGVLSSGPASCWVRHMYEWRKKSFSGSTGTSPDHHRSQFVRSHSDDQALFAVDENSDEDDESHHEGENDDGHAPTEVGTDNRTTRNERPTSPSSPTAWRDWVWTTGASSTSASPGTKADSSPGRLLSQLQRRRRIILIRRWVSTLEHLVGARSSLNPNQQMMEEDGPYYGASGGGTLGLLSPSSASGCDVADDGGRREYLWGPRYDPMKTICLSLSWSMTPSLTMEALSSSSAPPSDTGPVSGVEKNEECTSTSTTEGDPPPTTTTDDDESSSSFDPRIIPYANLRELPLTPRNLPPDTTTVRCHRDRSDDLAPCPLSAQLRCTFAAYIYTSTALSGDVTMSNFVHGGRKREHNARDSGGSDACFKSHTGTTTANLVDALADMVASDDSAPSRGDEDVENIARNIRNVMQYGNLWWAGTTASEEVCSGTVRSTEKEAIGSSSETAGVPNVRDVGSGDRSDREGTHVEDGSSPREESRSPQQGGGVDSDPMDSSLFLLSHSAPPGGLLSLLCFQMMHLVKSPVSMCRYWLIFLEEIRDHWHRGDVIPNLGLEIRQALLGSGVLSSSPFSPSKRREKEVDRGRFGGQMATDTSRSKGRNASDDLSGRRIDRSFCLLEQKLQVVNIGIEAAASSQNFGRCSSAATVEEKSPFFAESMKAPPENSDNNRQQLETEVNASGTIASLTPGFSLKLLAGKEQEESVTSDDNSSIVNDPSCDEAVKIGPTYCRDDDNVDDTERHSSRSGSHSLLSNRSGSFSVGSDAYDTADEAESDEVDAEYTHSDTTKDEAHRQRFGARVPVHNLYLKANGSQVYEPYLQPPLPLTTDWCIQRRVMMAQQDDRLRCSNCPHQPSSNDGTAASPLGNRLRVAHHYQRPKLSSDMSAFKAANPGSTFEDFLLWHGNPENPLEEYEDGDDRVLLDTLLSGIVSAGVDLSVSNSSVQSLSISPPATEKPNADEATRIGALEAIEILNTTRKFWFDTWENSESMPCSGQQSSLFDPVQEVESALHFLETLHPSQLLNQVLAINLSTAATLLATAAGPIRSVGAVDVALDRLMRCTQHALDQLMVEYHRSSFVDHVDATSSFQYSVSPKTLSACEAACNCVGEFEMLLSRATSLLHKFPGKYELVQEMLSRKEGEDIPVMSTENHQVESKLSTFLRLVDPHEAPWLRDVNGVDTHEIQTSNANFVSQRSEASLASLFCGPLPSIREYTIRNSDMENPCQLFVQIRANAINQREGNQQEGNNVVLALKRCSRS